MAIPELKNLDVEETVKQAIRAARKNPCKICPFYGLCGVKYKGTCKLSRKLRIALYPSEKQLEERQ